MISPGITEVSTSSLFSLLPALPLMLHASILVIFLKRKCSHVSLLKTSPWVLSSLRIVSRFLNLEIQSHSPSTISSSQMQPHLSPRSMPAPILQALITLWGSGVPSTQIALPPTHIVHQRMVSYYSPKSWLGNLGLVHLFLGTLLPTSGCCVNI